ncbi:MAG TPA: TIGR02452 family protein [Candidatus Limnocylindria bacterium]|jgi:uncharacterized protein (TIGR02452 family)|nr:TIGR02452 family protein [Candidatus Limnocylindria bacterium]
MSKSHRTTIAEETVRIVKDGGYRSPSGRHVDLRESIEHAVRGTRMYSLESLPKLLSGTRQETRFSVANETTFCALSRATRLGNRHVGGLNFASAKNPGGGFLNGAQAQEESLARSSALYESLLAAPDFYSRHRAHRSSLYLDLAIYSPRVPFFCNDDGRLVEVPFLASIITAAAPNAGAISDNEPGNLPQVVPFLRRRAELVLRIAQTHGIETLVLGAWGCGVFRNHPATVATIFHELLNPAGPFGNTFEEVLFAVYDRSASGSIHRAFADRFALQPGKTLTSA